MGWGKSSTSRDGAARSEGSGLCPNVEGRSEGEREAGADARMGKGRWSAEGSRSEGCAGSSIQPVPCALGGVGLAGPQLPMETRLFDAGTAEQAGFPFL